MTPRARTSVCTTPGCPTIVPGGGRCEQHQPAAWATSDRRARLPQHWNRIRLRTLRRYNHRCADCGNRATEVDHIVNGDDHSDSNLQALCAPCHRKKTQAEAARARWGHQRVGEDPLPPIPSGP